MIRSPLAFGPGDLFFEKGFFAKVRFSGPCAAVTAEIKGTYLSQTARGTSWDSGTGANPESGGNAERWGGQTV